MPKVLQNKESVIFQERVDIYEVDFLHVGRHPWRHQIDLVLLLVGVVRHAWACLNYFKMGNQQYLKEELIYEVCFLHMGRCS